ncbi:MAG: sulfatase-like hydrolase/transferase [Candidatus Magasanikbacteria bacterium]
MKKIIVKSLIFAFLCTAASIVISFLNFILDKQLIALIDNFKQLTITNTNSLAPIILTFSKAIFLYFIFFFSIFLIGFIIAKKTKKKRYIFLTIIPLLSLVTLRSMAVEPFLYQLFYNSSSIIKCIMDVTTKIPYSKIIFDVLITAHIITLTLIIAYTQKQRYVILSLWIILFSGYYIFRTSVTQIRNTEPNEETIIFIVVDSLRKDAIKNNPQLFLHTLYQNSFVAENMFTPNPATVPAMAAILSSKYPYTSRSTAMFLDKQLDISYINELKKDYHISIHTDSTDDDIINRSNFNIPFDYINAPYIDNTSQFIAGVLKKNVVLLSFIIPAVRNIFIPEYYESDINTNSEHLIEPFINYLKQNKKQKKIAFLGLGNLHIPYEARYPYYQKYPNARGTYFNWSFDHADYLYEGNDTVLNQNIKNLYLTNLTVADDQVKNIFILLQNNNLLANTTVVVLSDHGESLYENDLHLYSHNNIESSYVVNVPFLVYKNEIRGIQNSQNFALMDAIEIARHPENAESFRREFIYLETDLDLKDKKSPLYIEHAGDVYDTDDMNNMKFKDKNIWQQFKKRGIIYKQYQLTYNPTEETYSLYNRIDDPLYQTNIQNENPEIYAIMKKQLDKFIAESNIY